MAGNTFVSHVQESISFCNVLYDLYHLCVGAGLGAGLGPQGLGGGAGAHIGSLGKNKKAFGVCILANVAEQIKYLIIRIRALNYAY